MGLPVCAHPACPVCLSRARPRCPRSGRPHFGLARPSLCQLSWPECFCPSPPNSYVEALTPGGWCQKVGPPGRGQRPCTKRPETPLAPFPHQRPQSRTPASRAARNRFLLSVGHSGHGCGHRSPRALRQCLLPAVHPGSASMAGAPGCVPTQPTGGDSTNTCPIINGHAPAKRKVSCPSSPPLAYLVLRDTWPPSVPERSACPLPELRTAPFSYANRHKRGGGRGGHPRRGQTECLVCFPQRLLVVQPEPPSPTKTQILLETLHV